MEMREKERVDYIYFACAGNGRRKVTFQREEVAGIFVLKINYYERKKRKAGGKREKKLLKEESDLPQKIYKKMQRIIKKYQTDGCVLGADTYMADKLKMSELGFQARKQEMFQQKEYIFEHLKVAKKEGRSSMILVFDSKRWAGEEILSLLLTVKDYYEELHIVSAGETLAELNRIAEILYAEWGIVLHIQPQEGTGGIREYDFILFLLEKWDEKIIKKYEFRNAYIILDVEEKMIRNRVKTDKITYGYLYAGLFYEKQQIPICYQMAVDVLYQNSTLYDKLAVSCVDICCLECYNRE